MRYTRVYADEQGESHFEDVEVDMNEAVFAPPAPPLKLSEFMESSRFTFVSADPGWYGDWHPAPARQRRATEKSGASALVVRSWQKTRVARVIGAESSVTGRLF